MTAKERELIETYVALVKAGKNEEALLIAEEIRNIEETTETVKEEKEIETMATANKTKKDYTLNGTINATTWQEFRAVMKEAGINTATKTYAQLVEEYNALSVKEEVVSTDTTTVNAPETSNEEVKQEQATAEKKETVKHFDKLATNLVYKMLGEIDARKCTFDNRGLIHTKDLYKAIYSSVDIGHKGLMDDSEIKGYITALIKLGYLTFGRIGNNHLQFFAKFNVVRDDDGIVVDVEYK